MSKTKKIILVSVIINFVVFSILTVCFIIKTIYIINKIEENRIKKEKSTLTEIENVTLYEKNQVLKLLKKEYPKDEFEIIYHLSNIHKEPSKMSPSDRKVGKKFMVRPNGQVGEEFLVKYIDNDEDKLFSTPIDPVITSYYKDKETVETKKVEKILEEYIQPVLDKNLEGKERFKDYNMYVSTGSLDDLEWFKSIENVNDFFYTEPNDTYLKKIIIINIYINENEFTEKDLQFYYDCFQNTMNELARKIDYEKSSIKNYNLYINLHKLEQEEFNNIKNLDSQAVKILDLNKWEDNIEYYTYKKRLNIKNGEIIDADKETLKVNNILEEYAQPILNKYLEGKERFKDYNMYVNTGRLYDLEWFKSIENINDFFYTEPNSENYEEEKIINIHIYIKNNKLTEEDLQIISDILQLTEEDLQTFEEGLEFIYNSFKIDEEDLQFYYDCFENIANELLEKFDYEKLNTKEYTINIKLYTLDYKEFNNIKSLPSPILDISQQTKENTTEYYWYYKKVKTENGKITAKSKRSFYQFEDEF